jgi:hypothetical protein
MDELERDRIGRDMTGHSRMFEKVREKINKKGVKEEGRKDKKEREREREPFSLCPYLPFLVPTLRYQHLL